MCAYLFLQKKSCLCGLIRDCAFIHFSHKCLENTKNRQIFLSQWIAVSSKPALICNSDKGNDLFLRNVLINTLWVYSTLHNFQPCVLIRACAFIYKSKIFRPVHLFGSVHLLGSPKYASPSFTWESFISSNSKLPP